jgi:hypothetical protein
VEEPLDERPDHKEVEVVGFSTIRELILAQADRVLVDIQDSVLLKNLKRALDVNLETGCREYELHVNNASA